MDERVEKGMHIQLNAWRSALGAGVDRVGWKVGLNAPLVMEALELDRPVIGWLASGTTLPPGGEYSLRGGLKVGAEPELAITVGEGGAVAGLAAAIEVVDIDRKFDNIVPILAGNIFHRGVAFGGVVEPRELGGITARVQQDGEQPHEVDLAEVVGDPAAVIELVGGRLAEVGEQLNPGDRIIAGALTPILWPESGQAVALDMGPIGSISLRFG